MIREILWKAQQREKKAELRVSSEDWGGSKQTRSRYCMALVHHSTFCTYVGKSRVNRVGWQAAAAGIIAG
jgi:hypothetical protein